MRLDEQLPDRGPGAPVRPGGGSWMPALIVVAVVVASGGIFLAGQMQMQEAISDYLDMKRQAGKAARAKENDVPPVTRASGAERAEPIGSPAEWVTNDDYPAEALRRDEQGTVEIEFVIARNGRVSDCRVVQSSGSQPLDRKTCMLIIERALYSPAVDAEGRAVEQTSRLRFRWQISE